MNVSINPIHFQMTKWKMPYVIGVHKLDKIFLNFYRNTKSIETCLEIMWTKELVCVLFDKIIFFLNILVPIYLWPNTT